LLHRQYSIAIEQFNTFFENNGRDELVNHLPRTLVLFWNKQLKEIHLDTQDFERMKRLTQGMLADSVVAVNELTVQDQDGSTTSGLDRHGYRRVRCNTSTTASSQSARSAANAQTDTAANADGDSTSSTGSSTQIKFSAEGNEQTNIMRECLKKMGELLSEPLMLQQHFIDIVKEMQEQLQSKYLKPSYLAEEAREARQRDTILGLQIQLASVQVGQPLHVQPPAADTYDNGDDAQNQETQEEDDEEV
jgi:hypothetical protein